MIDPQARPAAYIRLMALVVVLGLISALVTFAFVALVHQGTGLIWEQAAETLGIDPRLFTILVCAVGGLVVGLLVKLFGDHNAIFAELMLEFGKTGRFNYRHAPGIVLTAFVSLISGASLGPEAPLADACGGIGTLMADQLKLDEQETRTLGYSGVSGMLAAFITQPVGGAILGLESAQGGTSGKQTYFWVLFPSLLASAVATVVFVLLSGAFFETLYQFPDYAPRLMDLMYAAPLGLIGGVVGLLFMLSLRRLQQLFQPMKAHVVLRGLLGGLGMGIIGALAAADAVLGRGRDGRTDHPCRRDRRGDADRVGAGQAVRHLAAARYRLERRLHLPHHVRQRRAGPGGEPRVSRHSSGGRRRGDDGRRAGRGFEGASVRGALYVGPGAKGNCGRSRRGCRCQRSADRSARAAGRPPRRITLGATQHPETATGFLCAAGRTRELGRAAR